jgi:hypothetical protein
MTVNEWIFYGAAWSQLHKNPIFKKALRNSFIKLMETYYFG